MSEVFDGSGGAQGSRDEDAPAECQDEDERGDGTWTRVLGSDLVQLLGGGAMELHWRGAATG